MTTSRASAARLACTTLVATLLGVLAVLQAGPRAEAADTISTTSTDVSLVAPHRTTPLTGAHVDGAEEDTRLQVTVSTTVGTLSISRTDDLDLSFGNSWSGSTSITFSGVRDALDRALETLAITTGADGGTTAEVTVTALVDAPGFVYSPSNGHFYEYVPAPGIDADEARKAAQGRSFLGQPGYLAAIPTAEINELVSSRIEGAESVWFGARSIDSYPYRTWVWGDGPLAGQVISSCVNFYGSCENVEDPGVYNAWAYGEPNNYGAGDDTDYTGEWTAVTNWAGGRGNWNDLKPSAGGASGYVVEYGDQVSGSTTFNGVTSSTSKVEVRGVPQPPTQVAASRGDSSASVSFSPPTDDGGSPVTGYVVTTEPGGTSTPCDASPCDVAGLTNGTSYTFVVRATNALGDSDPSDPSDAVTPAVAPGAPTDVSITGTDSSAMVRFAPPAEDGGSPVLGYVVTDVETGRETACLSSPCLVDGLDNGVTYTFTVRAVNEAGSSPPSAPADVTPVGLADAPRSVRTDRGNGSVTLTFEPPAADGGSPVRGYQVETAPGRTLTRCDASPCTVEGLVNGVAYTFTVQARNAAGLGRASEPTEAVTPATVPGAPTALVAERGDESAELAFDAPASDGGSAVTGYEVSLDGGDSWTGLDVSGDDHLSATVTGLVNGTTYRFEVRAHNDVGPGEAAGEASVTPARAPGTPRKVSVVPGDQQVTVSFVAPPGNGSPVTGYTVTGKPGDLEVSCTGSPCVLKGLANGTPYTFAVRATNDVGTSERSEPSAEVTPAGVPGAPELLAVRSGNGSLGVSFDPPSDTNGSDVVGYQVSVDGGDTWFPLDATVDGDHLSGSVHRGLDNGHRYQVQVRAVNGIGAGRSSKTLSATPATVPGAVGDLTVSVTGDDATVSWTAPASTGGSPVTGYLVVAQPGGRTCQTESTRCTISNLPAGTTYTFTVVASNADPDEAGTGFGAPAVSEEVTVAVLPSVPQALQVVPGDRRLDLGFLPPAAGGAVLGYQYSLDGGTTWLAAHPSGTTTLTLGVAPVLNGQRYAVAVRAVNGDGTGPAAAASVTTVQWFQDPVSKTAKAAQVKVPKKPQSYHGRLRSTRATMRAADETVAMPGSDLRRRQLQPGQAVNINHLFSSNGVDLTKAGDAQVQEVARSMTYVGAVTCEGYTDYRGRTSHLQTLSERRAKAVCTALQTYVGHRLTFKTKGYGLTRPVVVGGRSSSRWTNRRVVITVRE